jgi:hypothetical protein
MREELKPVFRDDKSIARDDHHHQRVVVSSLYYAFIVVLMWRSEKTFTQAKRKKYFPCKDNVFSNETCRLLINLKRRKNNAQESRVREHSRSTNRKKKFPVYFCSSCWEHRKIVLSEVSWSSNKQDVIWISSLVCIIFLWYFFERNI